MKDQICVVTGANSGIGFETARVLYQRGATVVMVCRNLEKARQAKAALEQQVRSAQAGQLDIVQCDLSEQASIFRACQEIALRYAQIDLLINNAGLIMPDRQQSPDGYEMTFAVNHLGTFLMTYLLMEKVKAAPRARIITVSSEAHRIGRFRAEVLANPDRFEPMLTYADSKLCNILFTRRLAQEVAQLPITANCLHPGGVATNFGAGFSGFYRTVMWVAKPFMISSAQGAQTSVYLATDPDIAHVTGEYFDDKKVKRPSPPALSQAHADRLWEMSLRMARADHWQAQMNVATS